MKSVLSNLTGLQAVLGKTKAIADTLWHWLNGGDTKTGEASPNTAPLSL